MGWHCIWKKMALHYERRWSGGDRGEGVTWSGDAGEVVVKVWQGVVTVVKAWEGVVTPVKWWEGVVTVVKVWQGVVTVVKAWEGVVTLVKWWWPWWRRDKGWWRRWSGGDCGDCGEGVTRGNAARRDKAWRGEVVVVPRCEVGWCRAVKWGGAALWSGVTPVVKAWQGVTPVKWWWRNGESGERWEVTRWRGGAGVAEVERAWWQKGLCLRLRHPRAWLKVVFQTLGYRGWSFDAGRGGLPNPTESTM